MAALIYLYSFNNRGLCTYACSASIFWFFINTTNFHLGQCCCSSPGQDNLDSYLMQQFNEYCSKRASLMSFITASQPVKRKSRHDEKRSYRRFRCFGRWSIFSLDLVFVLGLVLLFCPGRFRVAVERRHLSLGTYFRRLNLVRMNAVMKQLFEQTDGEEPEAHDHLGQRQDCVDILGLDSCRGCRKQKDQSPWLDIASHIAIHYLIQRRVVCLDFFYRSAPCHHLYWSGFNSFAKKVN